jgi:aspartyl-tRNA(Asn)/glutamyl-tRNA(Gln) amidotransferase subunit A
MELYERTIHDLQDMLKRGDTTSEAVTESVLGRIAAVDDKVRAYITVTADAARQQAKVADKRRKAGDEASPLLGIPLAIKDNMCTEGIATTCASKILKNFIPPYDATVVQRLKQAGAVICGKPNMDEFAMGSSTENSGFFATKNPWDLNRIPGGSSGGSAAAVAADECIGSLGSDTGGSIRQPAACCGVVGFKGTYGLIDMKGILEGEQPPDETIQWLSHAGITTRSVEDTALVLDVLAARNEYTKTANFFGDLEKNRNLRIGIANNFRADDDVSAAFEKAVEKIQNFSYIMSKIIVPFSDLSQGLGNIEAARKAVAEQTFKDIDLLLLPTIPTTTPSVKDASKNEQALSPEHTMFANYYGLPAVSVPCGFDKRGLPLGLQIVGKPWGEGAVLRLAHQYQMATDYSKEVRYAIE